MITFLQGDSLTILKTLPSDSVHCCVTSPPYWGLRDYGVEGQIGLEPTPEAFVEKLVEVFREVRRVLRLDGTCWVNLGDSYAGGKQGNDSFGNSSSTLNNGSSGTKTGKRMKSKHRKPPEGLKEKDLCGIPWRVAFALQADGWYLRSDIIWHKPNPMPESVTDRPTKSHEYIFLLTKSARYFYDAEAIKERSTDPESLREEGRGKRNGDAFTKSDPNGKAATRTGFAKLEGVCYPLRNKRSVWTVSTQKFPGSHFATFPEALVKPCILAGTKPGDTVLDPFAGSFTTAKVALELSRTAIGIELNHDYIALAKTRCHVTPGLALA